MKHEQKLIQAKNHYLKSGNCAHVAELFVIPKTTLYKYLKKENVLVTSNRIKRALKTKQTLGTTRVNRIKQLAQFGDYSAGEIAEDIGVSKWMVEDILLL